MIGNYPKLLVSLIVHRLQVLHDLMQVKLSDNLQPLCFAVTNKELFSDLYTQLFQWSNEYKDDSMTGRIQHVLGYDHPLLNQYILLRTRMEMAIHREMNWKHCDFSHKLVPTGIDWSNSS
ncbi:hypothetical protein [Paenibacillus lautus]|uniref:hypothetical protein n=1 Tax=Paenibacillus lautus TaxID=1401 RepID=UPI003D2CF8F4